MKIWHIQFTNHTPHWSTCYIEAATEKAARKKLREYLAAVDSDSYYDDTIWNEAILPEEQWEVSLVERPFRFVLGSGCR